MLINDKETFDLILNVTSAREVDDFITKKEADKEISWKPVGNLENNEGTIGVAIDPADSLFERITNSIDALIELRIEELKPVVLPKTPRDAIKNLFNLNMEEFSTFDSKKQRELAKNIILKIEQSDDPVCPTIIIEDTGIGQKPEEFPNTFLSLHSENKINKFYLMGQYGQGGSTSFAFAKYTIFISKSFNHDSIGWTIVRCIDPGSDYKRYTYQYLTTIDGKIPFIKESNLSETPFFKSGSIIRMIRYSISKYGVKMLEKWYHLCRNSLFDTLLPFLLYDKRPTELSKTEDGYIRRTRVIYGLKNSLSSVRVRHVAYYSEIEVPVTNRKDSTTIVRYWIFNTDVDYNNYLDFSNSPIVFTLNGQRQHREGRSFIYDVLNLKILQKRMIIQIDCDGLKSIHRKDFFSTTRSMIRETDLKRIIFSKVKESIIDDTEISRIMEDIRKEALVNRDDNIGSIDKKNVTELLKKWKTLPDTSIEGIIGDLFDKGTEEEEEPTISKDLKDTPTYIKCINKRVPIPVGRGKGFIIKFDTDAKKDYFTRNKKPGSFYWKVPRHFHIQSYQKIFKNGRFNAVLKTTRSANIGETFDLKFYIERFGLEHLFINVPVIIAKPRKRKPYKSEDKKKESQPVELPIEIVRVSAKDEVRRIEEKNLVVLLNEPVCAQDNEGILFVYINLVFKEYKKTINMLNVSPDTIGRRIDAYICYLAAHALSQYIEYDRISKETLEEKISIELREKFMRKEMRRVASTILPLILRSKF